VSAETDALPATLPGHWETAEGREMAKRYGDMDRAALCMGDRSDLGLANAVFLIDRNSLDLIAVQTAAKERIRWLSAKLAMAQAAFDRQVAGHQHTAAMLHAEKARADTAEAALSQLQAERWRPSRHDLMPIIQDCAAEASNAASQRNFTRDDWRFMVERAADAILALPAAPLSNTQEKER
jgi:hypothetical protein